MSARLAIVPILMWCLAVLFVAGIVHLSTILLVPRLAPRNAFTRVVGEHRPGEVVPLPAAGSPQGIIPFRDAALRSAICGYDLSAGPLRVTAPVSADAIVAVSFHSREGRSFYALTDSSAVDGKIEVLLLTEAQLRRIEAQDSEDEPAKDIRVTAPMPEGFVEFDILPRLAFADGTGPFASMRCQVERSD